MDRFKAVLAEHGYKSAQHERALIEEAGAEFIDADRLSTADALQLCAEADAVILISAVEVMGKEQEGE